MDDKTTLINWLNENKKLVALLAPSFPIVYSYPQIITRLKKLGFSYVIEVAAGAQKTNEQLLELMKREPEARFITSPCPTVVRMIKKTLPQYAKYFTHGVDSPMVASAKMAKQAYPDYQPVFIGPCFLKKMEAKEDAPQLNLLVLTFAELDMVFDQFKISEETNPADKSDIAASGPTRLYPLDGGLSETSGVIDKLNPEEVKVVSGVQNNLQAIKEFDENPKIKLLDILNCPGGCISGPGIKSKLTLEQKKQKILDYKNSL